jgi:hypothetical protein
MRTVLDWRSAHRTCTTAKVNDGGSYGDGYIGRRRRTLSLNQGPVHPELSHVTHSIGSHRFMGVSDPLLGAEHLVRTLKFKKQHNVKV